MHAVTSKLTDLAPRRPLAVMWMCMHVNHGNKAAPLLLCLLQLCLLQLCLLLLCLLQLCLLL